MIEVKMCGTGSEQSIRNYLENFRQEELEMKLWLSHAL
jgi:hypothetical protein